MEEMMDLYEQIETYLSDHGDIKQLAHHYLTSLENFEEIFGLSHPYTLDCFYNLIQTLLFLEHYQEVKPLIDEYITRVEDNKKHKILSYSVLSSYYYHIDNIDQALINIKEAYQLANEYYKMNDKENIEISLDYIKYLISVEHYQEAEILLKKHFPYIQSTSPLYSLYISAFIALYKHLGDYHQIRHYLHLLKESIDHLDQSINKEIAIISYAKQLVSIREYKEAKEVLEETYYRLNKDYKDHYLRVDVLKELSNISRLLGEKENERKYMEKAYELYQDMDSLYALGIIDMNNYDFKKAYDAFLKVYEQCIHLYGENNRMTYKALYFKDYCFHELYEDPSYIHKTINLLNKIKDEELYMNLSFQSMHTFIQHHYDSNELIDMMIHHINTYDHIPSYYLLMLAYYLHLSSREDEARYYALKGYDIVKETKEIFNHQLLFTYHILIKCGICEIEYIKEYFRLCKDELLFMYINNNLRERREKANEFKEIYQIFKNVAGIDDYNDLLKYKNILFDMEYYYYQSIEDEEIMPYIESKTMFQDYFINHGTFNMPLYNQYYEKMIHRDELSDLFDHDHLLKMIQDRLKEDECLIDFYDGNIIKMYIITKNNISLYKYHEDLLKDLNHYKHIYICNDGKTYHMIFEELLETSISYLSSAKYLLYEHVLTNKQEIEIIGDIDYDELYSMHRGEYHSLVFSRYEVNKIHHLFNEDSHLHHRIVTREEFLKIKQPYILHVSAHGEYNHDDDLLERGCILLSNHEKVSAKDIIKMDFKGTSIVSLASCYSGSIDDRDIDGVYGLQRAFELAGAKTLILVRGQINDMIAAAFMVCFYKSLAFNHVIDAFNDAKHQLMHMTLQDFDQLFHLNEDIIKEHKLGFYRRELYRILSNKVLLKQELNKFMIQGNTQ